MNNAAKELNLNLVMLNPGFLNPLGIYSNGWNILVKLHKKQRSLFTKIEAMAIAL
jgi:D-methionine transport system substrate-binding protein